MVTTLAIFQSGLTTCHRIQQPLFQATSWISVTASPIRVRNAQATTMSIRETDFQPPRPQVPPFVEPKRGMMSMKRSGSAPSTVSPREEIWHERAAKDTMVYEAIRPSSVILGEGKMPRERIIALYRSTCTTLLYCLCPLPSSELGDEESNTARMLSSFRHHPPYGYGSISAGPMPTTVSDYAWSTIPWRKRTSDSFVTQPTPQGNTLRS